MFVTGFVRRRRTASLAMSATVFSDAVPIPAGAALVGDPQSAQVQAGIAAAAAAAEVEFARCDCCGLTEECTPAYIERVRERYGGRWLCGLCAEAVKDEICRATPRLISTDEALGRHVAFCRGFRSSPARAASDAGEHFIAAVRQLLRRSLDSPRGARSAASSPRRKMLNEVGSAGGARTLPGGCSFPAFAG